ncbi:MAG: M20/M25/M40 family metallo-hydrolase [Oscillospiraceae bacterium]|nr:M20/M25/M40 family metallo-hydrolase [Oscillospiraceae bacterium]
MKEILKKLCAPIAVSGDEKNLAQMIRAEVLPYCESVRLDRAGNLICEKKGKIAPKHKIMLAAHTDEVGFIITHITEGGLLKFTTVGGIDARILPAKQVTICARKPVYGVIGIVPTHLLSGEAKTSVISEENLYIDIGAESRKAAEELVSLGDEGTLSGDFTKLGDGHILARALDDRCGCAALIKLLQSEVPCDITVCFTVQEEIGCRGAHMVTETVAPDIAIVIDSTTACDIQDVTYDKSVCNLGKGGVVSFMDRGCIYDKELFNIIMKTAKESGIAAQEKRAVAGANDSAAIHKLCGGVRTAAVSIPCRYLHTPACVIKYSDLEAVYDLVSAILPRFAQL